MSERTKVTTEQVAAIRQHLYRQCIQLRSHAVVLDRDVIEALWDVGIEVVNPDGSKLQGLAYTPPWETP